MYFELNRIAYKNDIERRKRGIEERYEYGLNKSPIKNHALAYGHERQKQLEACEDTFINKKASNIDGRTGVY